MSSCPNKSHPDWKALVNELGSEERAYEVYVENDYNIPKSFAGENRGSLYNSISENIENNPEQANKVIEKLKENFPDLDVLNHGVINDDGKFIPLDTRRGMHYRGAISAGVAWANDASIEVPPHEYAHDYIMLYRNHPIVKQAIEKYGEELLVTYMGRYYANKTMSNSFNNWVRDFWSLIKSAFRQPNVLDELSESFYKGEVLGKKEKIGDGKIRNMLGSFSTKPNIVSDRDLKQLKGFGTVVSKIVSLTKDVLNYKIYNSLLTAKVITKDFAKYINPKKLKKLNNEKQVKEAIQKLIKRQNEIELVTEVKDGKERSFYRHKKSGVELTRVSNIVNPDIDIDPKWFGSTDIGTTVDVAIRNFFLGDKLSYKDYSEHLTKEAFEELVDSLENFKEQLDEKGITLITGYTNPKTGEREEISLFDEELGIAGTVDVIAYDKDGNMFIWDMKTMRSGLDFYDNIYPDGSSKSDKHKKQLSIYAEMFENMTGNPISGTAIIPIKVKYAPYKNVSSQADIREPIIHERLPIDVATGKKSIQDVVDYGVNHKEFVNYLLNFKNQLDRETKKIFGRDRTNYSEVDQRLIEDVIKYSNANPQSIKRILTHIAGNKEITLSKREEHNLKVIQQMFATIEHHKQIKNKYIDENGYMVDSEVVNSEVVSEINTNIENKKKGLRKFPAIDKLAKALNNVLHFVVNDRLLAKYISGSENSKFSQFIYKTMERAQNDFHNLMLKVQDSIGEIDKKLQSGSSHLLGTKDITKLNTETISLVEYNKKSDILNEDVDGTLKDVPLTISEIMTIYHYSRQEELRNELLQNGVHLDKYINRDTKFNKVYEINEDVLDKIKDIVENDAVLMEQVEKTDKAFAEIKKELDPKIQILEGFKLPNIDNYFPVTYGSFKDSIRFEKNSIDNLRNARLRLGSEQSLKIVDYFQAIDSAKVTSSNYSAYAIPLRNSMRMLGEVSTEFEEKEILKWIKELEDTMLRYNDPSQLFSARGEKELNGFLNKIQGNFSVAVLAKNLGVVMKQQVSLQTAKMYMDSKYINQAADNIGPFAFINPMRLFKLLNVTGFKSGDTWMPIEWGNLRDSELLREMMEIPTIRARLQGVNSIEIGEAVLGKNVGEENINLTEITFGKFKNKDGSDILVNKARLMKSITLMDALTIMPIYEASKLEQREKNPGVSEEELKQLTQDRFLDMIAKTQPTFDYSNRSGLAKMSNPIAKSLTMFTSATQKIQMALVDKMIDVVNNPSKENIKKLTYAMFNTAILSSAILTSIDLLRGGLLYGWDDDDELYEDYLYGSIRNSFGTFHVLGIAINQTLNKIQNRPYRNVVQTPHEAIVQDGIDIMNELFKGDVGDSFIKSLEFSAKASGLPITTITNVKNLTKRVVEN